MEKKWQSFELMEEDMEMFAANSKMMIPELRCCINQDHALKRTANLRGRQKVPLRGTIMALS